jgi:putative ABC transport system permease protein
MTSILQDVRFAIRSLARTPAVAIITVLTFALGIGANTAVFSVVDGVLLRPLTYADPERLVVLHETVATVGRIPVGVVEFEEWGKAATSFEQLALIAVSPVILTGTGEPERLEGARVSASLFPMLGVTPALGRTFSAGEEVTGRHHVVILSDRLWRRRFGRDPSIVGRAITLNDELFVVAGVLPPRFRFPRLEQLFAMNISGGQPELWMPFAPTSSDRTENSYAAIGKLERGITIDRARAELQSIQHRTAQRLPNPPQLGADVVRLQDQVIGQSRDTLWLLWIAIASVLLIACGNIANLLLLRASARAPELAVRSALGAGRSALLRHSIVESLTLAAFGGATGIVVASWALGLLVRFAPANVPRLDEVAIDSRALTFTAVLTIVTGLLVGLLPARRAMAASLVDSLRAGIRTGSTARRDQSIRNVMVSMQTALTIACLCAASLVIQSLANVLRVEPGFRTDQVLAFDISLSPARYPDRDARTAFARDALQALQAIPGVTGAAVVNRLPLTGAGMTTIMVAAGTEQAAIPMLDRPIPDVRSVNADYFRTLGIRLRDGKLFGDTETRPVAVISAKTAQRAWPGESAIAKRFRLGAQPRTLVEVVGVVDDVRYASLESAPGLAVYLPYAQGFIGNTSFLLRTTLNEAAASVAVREAIAQVDRDVPLQTLKRMDALVADSVSARRFQATLLAIFGAIAVALAAIGIFGVMSYSVTLRSRELGIRLALGVTRTSVQKMVLGSVLRLVGLGLAVGVPLAVGAGYAMRGVLFGVSPHSPAMLAISTGLIVLVALFAAAIPARRAARVEPLVALRYE